VIGIVSMDNEDKLLEFMNKIYNKYGEEYSIASGYTNSRNTNTLFVHNSCKTEFRMSPKRFLNFKGIPCPKCRRGKK
jgi:hypothetical protein